MIYVLQVSPCTENKACFQLEREGIKVYVPKRELMLHRHRTWENCEELLFPGYVFIECEYNSEIHHKVKSFNEIIRFLGSPSPIVGHEESFMRLMFNDGYPISESKAVRHQDGSVTITSGWLKGKESYISGYNVRKKRTYLEINFGDKIHRTSVWTDFTKE